MTNQPASKTLTRILKLIQNGWCKGTYAKNANKKAVSVMDFEACNFCLVGATNRIVHIEDKQLDSIPIRTKIYNAIKDLYYPPISIEIWNDDKSTNKAMVIKVLNHAIKKAKLEEKLK